DRPPPYGGLVPRSSRQRAEGEPQANIFNFPVVIGERSHPFPFRTRKLSSLPPMVLRGKLRGRVGHCRDYFEGPSPIATGLFFSLSEGLRPSDSPARSLARRCAGSLRSRGSLAALARANGYVHSSNPGRTVPRA